MKHFWLTVVLLMPTLLTLKAQQSQDDGVIKMTPELPLVFPLAQNGKEITVQYPVLINPTTVLKPGMILRILYVLRNNPTDGSSDLALAHQGSIEQAYSRTSPTADAQSRISPELARIIERYRKDVWEVKNNFVLALAQYPTDYMHLIYSSKGNDNDLEDTRFSFFDGLFVGLPNGKVTVVAVEKGGKAEQAGLKAGDQILAVGDYSTNNDLATFATAYAKAKAQAHTEDKPSYGMTVVSGGGGATRQVTISLPPSLKNSFFQ